MALTSIADFSLFINRQIEIQENIEFYLLKLETLIEVSLTTNNFHDLSKSVLHKYFSMESYLIEEAIKANQTSLNELLKLDIF